LAGGVLRREGFLAGSPFGKGKGMVTFIARGKGTRQRKGVAERLDCLVSLEGVPLGKGRLPGDQGGSVELAKGPRKPSWLAQKTTVLFGFPSDDAMQEIERPERSGWGGGQKQTQGGIVLAKKGSRLGGKLRATCKTGKTRGKVRAKKKKRTLNQWG